MTPKTLLCPLDASASIDNIAPVLSFCETSDLHLKVILLQLEPPAPVAVEIPLTDLWFEELREIRARTVTVADELESALRTRGLSAQVQAEVCPLHQISDRIGLSGRFADLAVASTAMHPEPEVRSQIAFGLLFKSARPVLVESTAEGAGLSLTPRTVVVAWDGGLSASRAIGLATPLLKSAQHVHIVCVDSKGREDALGQAPGWDLASYLARHNIELTVSELPGGRSSVDQVVVRHATEVGADLIVMGAYGHSRLREKLLGGTTRAMLDHCVVPIFMAH